jgi:hypothetical protein
MRCVFFSSGWFGAYSEITLLTTVLLPVTQVVISELAVIHPLPEEAGNIQDPKERSLSDFSIVRWPFTRVRNRTAPRSKKLRGAEDKETKTLADLLQLSYHCRLQF